jgi:hypothetical protein
LLSITRPWAAVMTGFKSISEGVCGWKTRVHSSTNWQFGRIDSSGRCPGEGTAAEAERRNGAGYEWSLFLYASLSRRFDRLLKTRTSAYGWAFYFGSIVDPIDTQTWVNVCIRCGSGYSASFLMSQALVHSNFCGFRLYRCPHCGATNPFADDQ